MSADNYATVEFTKKSGWQVWSRNASSGRGYVVEVFNTRDEAIDYATSLDTEYGLRFVAKKPPTKLRKAK